VWDALAREAHARIWATFSRFNMQMSTDEHRRAVAA
jgi:hypothetical protein